MPTSSEIRAEKILKLYNWARYQGIISSVDPIYKKALSSYPTLTRRTIHSYAEAVLRMLKTTEKKEK